MAQAYLFPGQGTQYKGMGSDLLTSSLTKKKAKEYLTIANEILGIDIRGIMCEGSEKDLRQTKVTQPAIFLYSVIVAESITNFYPDAVAGHSLGEFSALVVTGYIDFQDGLQLVCQRATAMQQACTDHPGAMAAVLGLEDTIVEHVCNQIEDVVVAANYNCKGQLVISGTLIGVKKAMETLQKKGAKRILKLPVNGAFHSPLMESAKTNLAQAIERTIIKKGICPVYQNVTAQPVANLDNIKSNLIKQLTEPVLWTQSIQEMYNNNITTFINIGPSKVLAGLIKKIEKLASVSTIELP